MKSTRSRILRTFGLARARHLERLMADAAEAARKAAQLEERLAKLVAEVENWKRKYEELAGVAAERKETTARAEQRRDQYKADAERAEARVQEWKGRAEALTARTDTMRASLQEAQHANAHAREHLMAIEVKLDLIEAAIQLLDARSRETAVARPEKVQT